MQFLLLLLAVCTGLHAWSYGRLIRTQGNKRGAMGVYILVATTLSLSLYVIIK